MPSSRIGRNLQAPSRRPRNLQLAESGRNYPSTSSESSETCSLPKAADSSIDEVLQHLEKYVYNVNFNTDEATNSVILNINCAFKKHGLQLEKEHKDKVDGMFTTFRKLAMDPRLNFICRLQLLELIELRAAEWLVKSSYYGRKIAKLEMPDVTDSGDGALQTTEKNAVQYSPHKSCLNVKNWLKNIECQDDLLRGYSRWRNLSSPVSPGEGTSRIQGKGKENRTEVTDEGGAGEGMHVNFIHDVGEEEFLKRYSRHEEMVQETLAVNSSQAKSVFGTQGEAVTCIMEHCNAYIKFLPDLAAGAMMYIQVKGNRQAVNKVKELVAEKRRSAKSPQETVRHTSKTQVGLAFTLPQKKQLFQGGVQQQTSTDVKLPSYHGDQQQNQRTIDRDMKVSNYTSAQFSDDLKPGFDQLKEISLPFMFEIPDSVLKKTTLESLKKVVVHISRKSGCTMQLLYSFMSTNHNCPDGYITINSGGRDQSDCRRAQAFLAQAFYKISNPDDGSPPSFGESSDIYRDVDDLLKGVQPETQTDDVTETKPRESVAQSKTVQGETSVPVHREGVLCTSFGESSGNSSLNTSEPDAVSPLQAEKHGGIVVPSSEEDWCTDIVEYAKPHIWKPMTSLVSSGSGLGMDSLESKPYGRQSSKRKNKKKRCPYASNEDEGSVRGSISNNTSIEEDVQMLGDMSICSSAEIYKSPAEKRMRPIGPVHSPSTAVQQRSSPVEEFCCRAQDLERKLVNALSMPFCDASKSGELDASDGGGKLCTSTDDVAQSPPSVPAMTVDWKVETAAVCGHSEKLSDLPEKSDTSTIIDVEVISSSGDSHIPEALQRDLPSDADARDTERTTTVRRNSNKPRMTRCGVTLTRQPMGPTVQKISHLPKDYHDIYPHDKSAATRRRLFAITYSEKAEESNPVELEDGDRTWLNQPWRRKNLKQYSRELLLEIGKSAAFGQMPPLVEPVDKNVETLLVPEGWFDPVIYIDNLLDLNPMWPPSSHLRRRQLSESMEY